jgi:phosphodiesterase/alkaline phosphatase D-like protein
MCGAPANSTGWHKPGHFHSVVLARLQPNTRYYYVYGDVNENIWSPETSFVTAPPSGHDQTLDFFVFGDLGQAEVDGTNEKPQTMPPSINTTTALLADLTDQRVVFHIGDISYARGYVSQWETFFDQIGSVASRVPWMACPGN